MPGDRSQIGQLLPFERVCFLASQRIGAIGEDSPGGGLVAASNRHPINRGTSASTTHKISFVVRLPRSAAASR